MKGPDDLLLRSAYSVLVIITIVVHSDLEIICLCVMVHGLSVRVLPSLSTIPSPLSPSSRVGWPAQKETISSQE